METQGGIPEFISNDNILELVNSRTEPQGLRFIAVERNKNSHLRFETNLLTSADKGSELIRENTGALDSIDISATNIYPNSRWS